MLESVSVLKEQAGQMLTQVKVGLLVTDLWLETHPREAPGTNREFARIVDVLRESSGRRIDIRMTTYEGKLAYVPQRADAARTDITDREYYRVQQDEKTRGFHIAAPVLSRVTKKWGIPISIPAKSNGGNISVLFGAVELDTLSKMQEPLINFPGERLMLIRGDGIVLSSTPQVDEYLGKSVAGSNAWKKMSDEAGFLDIESGLVGGERRFLAYSHLDGYPVIAVRSVPTGEVLKSWRWHVGIVASIMLLFSLLVTILLERLIQSGQLAKQAWSKMATQTTELKELNCKLELLSVTDKLTQLFNRLQLDRVLGQEIARSQRYQSSFSVILLDIDHFKSVNDTHGHDAGDTTLMRVAKILKATMRAMDTVGRWGGEEFLLVLPETSATAAVAVAEKLRAAIAEAPIPVVGHVTASFGVSGYELGDAQHTLLKRADNALYEAKRSGRNRVALKGCNDFA